jgi:predicted nucleotidyltransferase
MSSERTALSALEDPAFRCVELEQKLERHRLILSAESRVLQLFHALPKEVPCALAVTGSYGRRDADPYSDLDLFLIQKRPARSLARKLRESCRGAFPISSLTVYELGGDLQQKKLFFWCKLLAARFLTGDAAVFEEFSIQTLARLGRFPRARLVELFHEDAAMRGSYTDPRSPHYYSIKNGYGGLLDGQILRLLSLHDSLQGGARRPAARQGRLRAACAKFLIALKFYLRSQLRSRIESSIILPGGAVHADHPELGLDKVPRFFYNDFIDGVRSIHHRLLTQAVCNRQEERP